MGHCRQNARPAPPSISVTWNTLRRNIFNWKSDRIGQLEHKVKTFCRPSRILGLLGHFIVFAEKDEELDKYILHQHQTAAVAKIIGRCHDDNRRRGLTWHTQGSGKTFTMIKAAEMLFKGHENQMGILLHLRPPDL